MKLLVFLLVILFVGLLVLNSSKKPNDDFAYSFTKAICTGNVCRDFVVECFDESVVEMRPISGFVVFGEDWVDKRENKELC